MATLSYPGVYVEEVSSGVRPIAAAGTSTAAFFGKAQKGPIGEVKKIFNFTEFQTIYGGFLENHYLAHSVYQFFNNGGTQCYIGRVARGANTAGVTVKDRGGDSQYGLGGAEDSLTISAISAGVWGNHVMVAVNAAAEQFNRFNLTVCQDNPKPGEDPLTVETFEDLNMDPESADYVQTVVNSRSKFIRISVNSQNPNQIKGYSEGKEITVDGSDLLGSAKQRKFLINMHGEGLRTVDLTDALKTGDLTKLETVRSAIETTIQGMKPLRDSTDKDVYKNAAVTLEGTSQDKLRITSGLAAVNSRVEIIDAENPDENAAGSLLLGRRRGGTEVSGSAAMRPQDTPANDFYYLGDDTTDAVVSSVVPGSDGIEPGDTDYEGALAWLDAVRDVSLIAVPGASQPVTEAGMNYCRKRSLSDCFFIADMPREYNEYAQVIQYKAQFGMPNSYGAVYYPWLKMADPLGLSPEPVPVPPCGFAAGMYARIDAKRGVWKAPAGTEAIIAGAVGLTDNITDIQHGNLNKGNNSVCVLRAFPGTGIVAWGSRTLSSDPEYKYIPVRRMAIMLRVSIFDGIQWAVFEPNDEELWGQLRLNIGSFMMTLFRRGAFQGSKPSEAFFVKCDGETTTQDDINLGIVNVLVGFAPLKPAEFVVVKISQKAGQP
jgi:phage tail sheath protein FI